jgi:uncharacterized membrane protein YhaH (DUF805 family)
MKPLYRIKISSLVLLIALFGLPVLFGSALRIYSMPINDWQRPTWFLLFAAATLLLVIAPAATAFRQRRISRLDWVCWVSVLLAWIIYPLGIHAYCDYANRSRSDTWRWSYADAQACYYFMDSRNPDSFAGLIEAYPPYFSFPKR